MPHPATPIPDLTARKSRVRRAVAASLLAVGVVASAVQVGGAVAVGPGAADALTSLQVERAAKPVQRGVTVTTSRREVEEGDRFTVTVRIKGAREASRVTFEQVEYDYFRNPSWETVKSMKVRGRSKVTYSVVATNLDLERFRVAVSYKPAARGKPSKTVRSKPVNVKVWRWVPMSGFAPYYETSQVGFGDVTINGRRYKGWGPHYYSTIGSWEARFTPGRNCRSFRSVVGLSDISDDGSNGTIAITAENETIYTSPALTPGMENTVTMPLRLPYRIGFQVTDTSVDPDGVDLHSWPVLGEPALLCRDLP